METEALNGLFSQAKANFSFSQAIRRDLHAHPELGFQEFRTSSLVAQELSQLGYQVSTGIAQTGVIAVLQGDQPGPVVMARFDMDALPIHEETGAEYSSQNAGVMHACGHDGHVAIGLTVARLLMQNKARMHGTVKLVFQPAEEGLGGAEGMIAAGALEDPRPDACIGLHLWNERPVGWVAIHPGPIFAGGEVFDVTIEGRGGHGALPHLAVDPILAAAHVITALQSIVSRNVSPLQAGIVSVTQIHSGDTFNVIPKRAELNGTIRTYEGDVRAHILTRFEQIVTDTCKALGCSSKVDIRKLTPAVINHPQLADLVAQAAAAALPDLKNDSQYRTTASEDMAYFMEKVPGCFFLVGSSNQEQGLVYSHHHPKFDFDEQALVVASTIMTAGTMAILSQPISRITSDSIASLD